MIENLNVGLQVTGLGMGLVFLTLLICMAVIMLLDRIFRAKAEPALATRAAEGAVAIAPPAATPDEAVAVAVALALQQRKQAAAVQPAKPKEPGDEIVGGVMILKPIVPAPWSGAGRRASN
ncbi:MAG: OadG family protein [Chloroflexi bacterium]|nr:OadG family protein [Chloroflexota bacterium]